MKPDTTFKELLEQHSSCRHEYCNLFRPTDDKTLTKPCWQVILEDLRAWTAAKKAVLKTEKDNLKSLVCPKCGRDNCGSQMGIAELEHTIKWIEVNLEG